MADIASRVEDLWFAGYLLSRNSDDPEAQPYIDRIGKKLVFTPVCPTGLMILGDCNADPNCEAHEYFASYGSRLVLRLEYVERKTDGLCLWLVAYDESQGFRSGWSYEVSVQDIVILDDPPIVMH